MAYGHIYTLRHVATVNSAITIAQIKAGAASPLEILRAWVNQNGSTTSAQARIGLVRKTSGATGLTTAVVGTHLFKHRLGDPTPDLQLGTAATGVIATGEGTDGDIVDEQGFNVLNGWEKIFTPLDIIHVPAGGIIGLKFMTAPASHSWEYGLTVRELG